MNINLSIGSFGTPFECNLISIIPITPLGNKTLTISDSDNTIRTYTLTPSTTYSITFVPAASAPFPTLEEAYPDYDQSRF
jgi:hypothetical protein